MFVCSFSTFFFFPGTQGDLKCKQCQFCTADERSLALHAEGHNLNAQVPFNPPCPGCFPSFLLTSFLPLFCRRVLFGCGLSAADLHAAGRYCRRRSSAHLPRCLCARCLNSIGSSCRLPPPHQQSRVQTGFSHQLATWPRTWPARAQTGSTRSHWSASFSGQRSRDRQPPATTFFNKSWSTVQQCASRGERSENESQLSIVHPLLICTLLRQTATAEAEEKKCQKRSRESSESAGAEQPQVPGEKKEGGKKKRKNQHLSLFVAVSSSAGQAFEAER